MARNNKHRSKPQSTSSNQKKSPNKAAKNVTVGDIQVMVNGYSEQWLRQQFDWVYDKEILGVGKRVKKGNGCRDYFPTEAFSWRGNLCGLRFRTKRGCSSISYNGL